MWSNGATTQCVSVNTPGTYSVMVTDANGCTATCSQVETSQICYSSPTNPNVTATQSWTIDQTNQTVTIRTTFAKTFVDNTYGTNAVNWPNGHTFGNLTGSDKVQLALYDISNVKRMELKIDYLSSSSAAPSGYKSLGVLGGEGGMVLGSASNVVGAMTSLDKNLNEFGYVLTTNSPATNASYAPNATYPNWIFDVWYEVTVKLSAFPGGFGRPMITDVHASPSKTGNNTEIVNETPCPPCPNPLNLGNLVWLDLNNNGVKNTNEPGLSNYTVKVYADPNNNNTPNGAAIATATTNASGIYNFSGLAPNNYIVCVTLKTGDQTVSTNGGDPDNNIDNDNNGMTVSAMEYCSRSVSLNFGTEPTNDGDGSDGNLSVDFAIFKDTPTDQVCYVGVSHTYVKAVSSWTINVATNSATIRTTFSKNFVDNTYGTNAIGWNNGHSFNNLTGSDKLQLALYDINDVRRLEFEIDYISSSSAAPSGYKSLCVSGGDGGMVYGNSAHVLSCMTSLDSNFNALGYVLTTNSPATNSSYAPNASYPNWIFDVWYEVTVSLDAFPAGFGKPKITEIHASPSKTGSNTEVMEDTICVPGLLPRLAAISNDSKFEKEIVAIAYPNPFGNDITIEFRSPDSQEAEVTITDITGRVVDVINHSTGILRTGSDLKPGIYMVNIKQGEYNKVIKIVKSAGSN